VAALPNKSLTITGTATVKAGVFCKHVARLLMNVKVRCWFPESCKRVSLWHNAAVDGVWSISLYLTHGSHSVSA